MGMKTGSIEGWGGLTGWPKVPRKAWAGIWPPGDREDGLIGGSDQIGHPTAWKYHGDI